MYIKSLVVIVIGILFSIQVNAQANPGGVGTQGNGQGAQDVGSGSGSNSGNQGVSGGVVAYGSPGSGAAPIDGGIFLLIGVSAVYVGFRLTKGRAVV